MSYLRVLLDGVDHAIAQLLFWGLQFIFYLVVISTCCHQIRILLSFLKLLIILCCRCKLFLKSASFWILDERDAEDANNNARDADDVVVLAPAVRLNHLDGKGSDAATEEV